MQIDTAFSSMPSALPSYDLRPGGRAAAAQQDSRRLGRQGLEMLTLLIGLFTVGYLVSPFFSALPADSIRLIVSLIFLFGAVYVILTVRLLYRIIAELTE